MVTLDWDIERTDGVTLVRVYVTADWPRRVRVENRLDGPVWPPRRRGRPAAGWDDGGFEGIVTPENRLVAGYATPGLAGTDPGRLSPAPDGGSADAMVDDAASGGATDTPVRLGSLEVGAPADTEPTPAGVVRSLGDPLVPRDAVPVPDPAPAASDDAEADPRAQPDGDADSTPGAVCEGEPSRHPDTDPGESPGGPSDAARSPADGGDDPGDGRDDGEGESTAPSGPDGADARSDGSSGAGSSGCAPADPFVVPRVVRAWLRDVDERLGAVERGDGGAPLRGAVAADRRALARVSRRVDRLGERAAAVTDQRDRRTAGER
ncbi:hypothetical protein BRC92_09640 [Halobacteriales archaeon QS_4_69_31]|nr:MAG: hypothetical protein BRC92_09640 [Halobacteriales archaeon QS_4_69_31]